jgi:hypothetical protein
VSAIAGAVLLGVQVSANYWSYMYLVWVLPFLVLSLLNGPTEAVSAVNSAAAAVGSR